VHKCINHPTYRETAKALLREVSYVLAFLPAKKK
jgi:hypothetical protein